jgi:hypothetical protein
MQNLKIKKKMNLLKIMPKHGYQKIKKQNTSNYDVYH